MTQLLVCYDYDDTMLPSSFIAKNNELSEDSYRTFREIENLILEQWDIVFELGGSVLIVTAAEVEWILQSSAIYFPIIRERLRDIPILSTRDFPRSLNTTESKFAIFDSAVRFMWPVIFPHAHFLSIGDGIFELKAAQSLRGNFYKKTIKLSHEVMVTDKVLLGQLRTFHSRFTEILTKRSNMNLIARARGKA